VLLTLNHDWANPQKLLWMYQLLGLKLFYFLQACETEKNTCIQKIIKDLVPSFNIQDIRYDLDRCFEIDHWLSEINKKL